MRDSKGRFKKNDDDVDETEMNLLERPPTIKAIMIIIFLFWILSLFAPKSTEVKKTMKGYMCDECTNCTLLQPPNHPGAGSPPNGTPLPTPTFKTYKEG